MPKQLLWFTICYFSMVVFVVNRRAKQATLWSCQRELEIYIYVRQKIIIVHALNQLLSDNKDSF